MSTQPPPSPAPLLELLVLELLLELVLLVDPELLLDVPLLLPPLEVLVPPPPSSAASPPPLVDELDVPSSPDPLSGPSPPVVPLVFPLPDPGSPEDERPDASCDAASGVPPSLRTERSWMPAIISQPAGRKAVARPPAMRSTTRGFTNAFTGLASSARRSRTRRRRW
jgi:hypothetical protein